LVSGAAKASKPSKVDASQGTRPPPHGSKGQIILLDKRFAAARALAGAAALP